MEHNFAVALTFAYFAMETNPCAIVRNQHIANHWKRKDKEIYKCLSEGIFKRGMIEVN